MNTHLPLDGVGGGDKSTTVLALLIFYETKITEWINSVYNPASTLKKKIN